MFDIRVGEWGALLWGPSEPAGGHWLFLQLCLEKGKLRNDSRPASILTPHRGCRV